MTAAMNVPGIHSGHGAGTDCCTLSDGPISKSRAQLLAIRMKALSDPTRLRLLSHVASQGHESVCACDVIESLGVNQSTVSHHMKKLVDAGLLEREQRGRWAYYTVIREAFEDLRSFLDLG
ncbi:ArsR/SmtB family transcription factor [Corynebacterium halotolerans]|uniref:ArsR/SmtB family transcription factor n=1 Tax=Corynebacterium halotolerans TaxID=225326 RepID=UPI003CF55AD6